MAYEVFDAAGNFTGLGPINVYATDAWDAGTEVNDNLGAAFNAAGGDATDAAGVIARASDGLFFLDGQATAAGTTTRVTDSPNLLARIEVSQVPLPAGFPLLLAGLGGLGLLARRKR